MARAPDRMLLTAVSRLVAIEDCEASVAGMPRHKVTYKLEFSDGLLAFKQATQVLEMAGPDGFATEVDAWVCLSSTRRS